MRSTYRYGLRIAAIAVMTSLSATACSKTHLPILAPSHIAQPNAADVESVLYTMGDAGDARWESDPALRVMQADVESWSGKLRDSSVVVLFLGDNVYPAGLRSNPTFPADSAALQAQVDVVNGPQSRAKGVRGIFIAGNHDWGQTKGLDGLDRLKNQEAWLNRRRAEGTPVWLMPAAGTPGPLAIDVGARLRILLMDSAWWLLTGNDTSKSTVYRAMKTAVDNAGQRNVVVAAHHPFRSASSHGGLMPFWSGLGLRFLLNRSGAVLQDLSSLPYRSLTQAFEAAFADHQPLLFAGGHDHNLQVIQGQGGPEPKWMIVSGAGSKRDDVGNVAGMKFRAATSGYMRIVFYRDGRSDVYVVGAPGALLAKCTDANAAAREKCMATTAATFSELYSARMK